MVAKLYSIYKNFFILELSSNKVAKYSSISYGMSQLLQFIFMILCIKLTIPYMGIERFGAWMAINSLITILAFLDFGIGNALANKSAEALASNSVINIQKLITGGIGSLLTISLGMSFFLECVVFLFHNLDYIPIKNEIIKHEVYSAIYIYIILFFVSILINGINKIYNGLQISYIGNIFSSITTVLSIMLMYYLTYNKVEMMVLLFGIIISQILLIILLIKFLEKKEYFQFSKLKNYTYINFNKIIKIGSGFFFLQFAGVVGWGCDLLIIAKYLGSIEVARYSILQKLFLLLIQPILIYTMPLWGIYAGAHSRLDFAFIKQKLIKTLKISAIYAFFAGVVLVIFGNVLIGFWSGNSIHITIYLYILYFILATLIALGTVFTTYMNGCGIIKPQIYASLLFIIISFVLKILFSKYGLNYFIISTIIAYIISTPILYTLFFERDILEYIK